MKVRVTNDKYTSPIGRIVEVSEETIPGRDGMYYTGTAPDNISVYVHHCEIVPDETTPRLYIHEGVKYELPEWANFVTRDNEEAALFAWQNKPEYSTGIGFYTDKGQRERINPYVVPIPEGAFIVELS